MYIDRTFRKIANTGIKSTTKHLREKFMNGYEEINMDRNLRHLVSPNAIIRSKIAVHTYVLSSLAQMTPTQKNH